MERVTVRPLTIDGKSLKERFDLGREVQRLVSEDLSRLGVDRDAVRTIADPGSLRKVGRQIHRLATANVDGVVYGGIYEDEESDELHGVVKVGLWNPYDAEPFGREEVAIARSELAGAAPDARTRGLHVFAVEPELATPALRAVCEDDRFMSNAAVLNAAIHEADTPLHTAYTELGAPREGRRGSITLGSYTANYVLRTLPLPLTPGLW